MKPTLSISTQRMSPKRRFLLVLFLASLVLLRKNIGALSAAENLGDTYPIFLPLIQANQAPFFGAEPIWATNALPSGHTVALFRAAFALPEGNEKLQVRIFADTRYEVWLDGQWVGRGPARFTTSYREYDLYPLNTLPPGPHQIAILVQWSPDLRRSESITPHLQAALVRETNGLLRAFARTDSTWKALVSSAWEPQAAPVHPWQLIGYTELMDFREFPWGWQQTTFDDQLWPNAVPVSLNLNGVTYRPRSIPALTAQPVPYTLLDAGQLSPGMNTTEIVPPVSDPYVMNFTALGPTVLTLERLQTTNAPTLFVDGSPLAWTPAPSTRPDTQTASVELGLGAHTLLFQQLPADGFTFNHSVTNLSWTTSPFQQGLHAGRRLLLANYLSTPGVVTHPPNLLTVTPPPAYFVLELPRVTHGRLVVQVTGPSGTVVDIGWSERLLDNTTRPLPYPGTLFPDWNQTDSWVLDGSTHELTTLDARAGRYILIAVWGSGPVTFQNLQILEERYPVTQTGTFTSADPRLNQIWQMGVDTAAINMLDAYADPWRERGQWWGDAYVVDQVNQVAFGDQALLHRGLLLMANEFLPDGRPVAMAPNGDVISVYMLDYGMLWLHSLQENLLLTGNSAFAQEFYPTLLRFMAYLAAQTHPETGLIDLPKDHWSQIAYIDTYGFHDRYGQATALNSIYYATLLRAAWIAEYFGDDAQANAWTMTATTLRAQIHQTLYDPLTHQYAATSYQGQFLPPSYQAQAWTLAYGIVPAEEIPFVAENLLALIPPDPATAHISIYGMYWILEGLAQAGRMQDAINLIDLYYGYLLDQGATTLWERFDSDRDHKTSLSHGWGGAPTWFLSTHVAGFQQTGPTTWQVQPALTTLNTLSATFPLPNGPLTLSWQTTACQTTLTLQAPENTEGTLFLPHETLPIQPGQTTLQLPDTCPEPLSP
jgi:alpha-L-rhamnosidase